MASPARKIFVTRGGKPLGEFNRLQVPSLFETGSLEPDDWCVDPETGNGCTVADFVRAGGARSFRKAPPADPAREAMKEMGPGAGRPSVAAVLGWVFFLLTLAGLAGALFWVDAARRENEELRGRIAGLEAAAREKQREYDRLLFAAREVAEPGIVRGRVILRDRSNKRIGVPGVKVLLFERAAIDRYLAERAASAPEFNSQIERAAHFIAEMPAPVEAAATNADGRYEFSIAQPGEYVIYTSIAARERGGREARLWFVGFDSRDELNTPVDITESNAVVSFDPLLMVVDGRN